MKINEIKELLQQDEISKEVLAELRNDERSGVKKLLSSYDKMQEKKLFYKKEYEKKYNYCSELSMGMSNDYIEALKNGATILRIGSKLYW